jgi:adenine C2-methylase RlmN of 23S rRNA A2503 and tRNA A37
MYIYITEMNNINNATTKCIKMSIYKHTTAPVKSKCSGLQKWNYLHHCLQIKYRFVEAIVYKLGKRDINCSTATCLSGCCICDAKVFGCLSRISAMDIFRRCWFPAYLVRRSRIISPAYSAVKWYTNYTSLVNEITRHNPCQKVKILLGQGFLPWNLVSDKK